jgi:hypothetical protein
MITTLGFPVRAGHAHHCQGQSPNSLLVRFIFDELYAVEPFNKYSALFLNFQSIRTPRK